MSASWRCRIAPARQRLQAHRSLTMHLAGPTIAERAISRRHLGEHPAKVGQLARQRKGVGGARTLNGESACATPSCCSKKPDASCDTPGGTSGVCSTVCL